MRNVANIVKLVDEKTLAALVASGYTTYKYKTDKTIDGVVLTIEQVMKLVHHIETNANIPPAKEMAPVKEVAPVKAKVAASEEPVFTFHASDSKAYAMVKAWADYNAPKLGEDHHRVVEARKIAREMEEWRIRNSYTRKR